MALIDIRRFHDGNEDCLISDSEIEKRIALVLSHLSKCLFDPKITGFGRGEGSFIPDRHQLLAIENFINPWLGDIFSSTSDGAENLDCRLRNEFILADEGGMGKTFSSVIAALYHLKQTKGKGSIVVLCSPLVKEDWYKAFKSCNIKVSRKSATVLSNATLDEGVTIISKHSLQHHPLTNDAVERLSKKIEFCILDEAHEGMITDDDWPELRMSIEKILKISKKNLIVTATPIRKNWGDLKRLLEAVISDERDLERLRGFPFSNQWLENLRDYWFPAINRLGSGTLTSQDIVYITNNIEDIIPLINDEEIAVLKNNLPIILRNYDSIGDTNRERIARDLHPFGKYISISLRDDLGRDKCEHLYRKKRSRTKIIKHWDEVKELMDYLGEKDWKYNNNILISNPENVLKIDGEGGHYYASLEEIDKDDPNVKELCKAASEKDPRYIHLEEICEEVKSNHIQGQKAGVVIFSNFEGTSEKISEWCGNKGYNTFNFQAIKRNDENDNRRNGKLVKMKKILEKAEKDSLRNNKTTVFICGKDAAVGLNMAWANHVVHWDIEYGAIENINQRTWRLDRRWNGSDIINQEFSVTYMVLEDKVNDGTMERANNNFKQNRILLGDRRFLNSNSAQVNNLFDETESGWVEDSVTDTAKGDSITTDYVKAIWDWCSGNIIDNSGIAENMWICSLKDITGINLDLSDAEKEILIDRKELGISNSELHDLMTLASANERASLQFIGTSYRTTKKLMTQFGIANIDAGVSTLNLLPDGLLATKIMKYLKGKYKNSEIEIDFYPCWIRSGGKRNIAYAIHLGILDILNTKNGEIISDKMGQNTPTGIIFKEREGKWKHILRSEVDSHIDNFKIMLEYRDYRADEAPDRDFEQDVRDFLEMEKPKDMPIFNWRENLLRFSNEELKEMITENNELEILQLEDISSIDMLPVLLIQRNGEKDKNCWYCGNSDSCDKQACNEWKGELEGWL